MNLSVWDWGLIFVSVVALRFVSLRAKSHMKGVADFLSANRSAGRYLLTIANGMSNYGTISFIAVAQVYMSAGFTPIWWGFMTLLAGTVIVLTGWIYYRYRETRAMTMGQFFEMRYTRRFRIFAATLTFISGIINFGIFPAVAARFIIYFCGLPDYFSLPGVSNALQALGLSGHISTFASIMLADLSLALYFVLAGGQISVMVTECVQGIFVAFAFLIIVAYLLLSVSWSNIVTAAETGPAIDIRQTRLKEATKYTAEAENLLKEAQASAARNRASAEKTLAGARAGAPQSGGADSVELRKAERSADLLDAQAAAVLATAEARARLLKTQAQVAQKEAADGEAIKKEAAGKSMLHPYHTGDVKDFNIWFYLIGIFGTFYTYMAFQDSSGFTSAGKSPHEQRMGQILSVWRRIPTALVALMMPIAAYAILKCADFAPIAAVVNADLARISDETVRDQMTMPVVLAHFLPIGIKGLLATAMIFFSFTCHDTYMHSWGTIFVQDVLLPVRQGLGRAVLAPRAHIKWLRLSIGFVALFAFLFSLFYPQTHQILMFMAISGTIWLGGAGPVIIGGLYWKRGTTAGAYCSAIVGPVLGIWGLCANQVWQSLFQADFPINGQVMWFIAMVSAGLVYIGVSLLTAKSHPAADMDKLLHRGRYAVGTNGEAKAARISKWREIAGIRQEFTFSDKLLAYSIIIWNFGWFFFFLALTAIHFTFGTNTEWWTKFWHFYVIMQFCIGVPAVIGLSIGGILDIRALFKALDIASLDASDDGRVTDAPAAKPNSAAAPLPGSGSTEAET